MSKNQELDNFITSAISLVIPTYIALVITTIVVFNRRKQDHLESSESTIRTVQNEQSYLRDEFLPQQNGFATKTPRVKSLWIYPIKSCRGIELSEARITETGLEFDRLFTFGTINTSATKPIVTSLGKIPHDVYRCSHLRDYPQLARITTAIKLSANRKHVIEVTVPIKPNFISNLFGSKDFKTFFVPLEENTTFEYPQEKVYIWKEMPVALNYINHAKDVLQDLRQLLGLSDNIKLGLFRLPPTREREVFRNAPRADVLGRQPLVGFADSYPIHLLSMPSVIDMNNHIRKFTQEEFSIRRFRPNIIIDGTPPFIEDTWKKIQIGKDKEANIFHIATRCIRCKLPNVHPETGEKHAAEPDRTLRKYRCVDAGSPLNAALGVNMVPAKVTGTLRVGKQNCSTRNRREQIYSSITINFFFLIFVVVLF